MRPNAPIETMKNLSTFVLTSVLAASWLAGANSSIAQTTSYWDPGFLNASPGSGGSGAWNSASSDWWTSGIGDSAWTSGNIADFSAPAGTVSLGAAETIGGLTFGAAGYTISGSSTLTLSGPTPTVTIPGGTTTISSIIAGATNLTLAGSGTLNLNGANTYTGGTIVSTGTTLQVNNPKGAGAGTIAISTNGVFTLNSITANSVAAALPNAFTGGTNATINVIVSTANTYTSGSLAGFTGTINVSSSVSTVDALVLQAAGPYSMAAPGTWNILPGAQLDCALANAMAANIIINGPGNASGYGALRLNSDNITGNILLAGTGTNVNNNQIGNTANGNFVLSGVISDAGGQQGLNRVGYPGAPTGIAILQGENTYAGPTTLTSNITRLGSAEIPGTSGPLGNPAVPANSIIFPASGTLQYSPSNQFDYSSRFSSASNQHYIIDVNGQSVTFASGLSSSGGTLTVSSSTAGGSLTLTGTNTYSGSTTLSSGALDISGSIAGNLTVNGGTLQLNNSSALSSGAILTLPVSPSTGLVNLNFTGTQTISNLLFGAVIQSAGTWGPVGSSATFQSSAFAGTGILRVSATVSYPQAYWDPNNSDALPGSGGSGSWDTSTADWWASGSSDITWPANNVANFDNNNPGQVSINNNVTANGLNFSVDGYSIQQGTAGATLTLAGLSPIITVPTNGTTAITCPVAGTVGLVESGPGTLVLTASNSYSGITTVGPGSSLSIYSAQGAGNTSVALGDGASFTVNNVSGNAATPADTIANGLSGGTNTLVNINEYAGNTFLTGSYAGFSGAIYCYTGGGAAAVVIEAAGPMAIPAAATWNIGNSATVDFNAGGTDAAQVVLNGPGSFGNFGALRLDSCTQTGNILLTQTSDIGNAGNGTLSTISGVISDGGSGFGINRLGYPLYTNYLVLSGENTYSGQTALVSNTLRVASAENPGVSGPLGKSAYNNPNNISFVGGILQYSSANQYDYSGRFNPYGNQPFNIDLNGQQVTFATGLGGYGSSLLVNDTAGGGSLTLSGANNYTGATTVLHGTLKISGSITGNLGLQAGALEFDNSAALSSSSSLLLPASPTSGQINLNFVGTMPISAMFLGGAVQAAGTWGAVGSSAQNQSPAFSGTGILNITGQNFYYWDASGTDASSGSSTQGGGAGSWDSGTADWWNTGNSDTTWPSDGFAFFEGTPGAITLNNDETVDNLEFTTSGYVINGGSTLTLGGAAPAILVPNGGAAEVDCNLAGSAGLIQGGAGTLILGGVNTYSGNTSIAAGGTLALNSPAGAGSSAIVITGNGRLDLNSIAGTVPNAVSGPTNSAINIQASAGFNTFLSGSFAAFSGTINCLAGGPTVSTVVEAAGPINVPATATWNIASGATLDFNVGRTDNGTVIINGPGGSANFGALRLDSAIQAGPVILAGPGNNNQIGSAGNGTVNTISGVITDNGLGYGLNRVGYPHFTNVIALSAENTYSGATTLTSNILRVASAENPGISGPFGRSAANNPGSIIFAGGTLQYSSANSFDYSGRFSKASGQPYSIDVNGQPVAFGAALTAAGCSLALMDTTGGGSLTLSTQNNCAGGVTVNNGTLDIGATASVAGNVIVNGGTLEMDNAAAMPSSGSMSVGSSAIVNLNYAGSQTIAGLVVNGAIEPAGTYGAGASNPGEFTGTGTLTVTGRPSVTISSTAIAGQLFTVCWTSLPGVNYNVYTTTNLSSQASWTQDNGSPIQASGGTTCYTLSGSTTNQTQIFVAIQSQ
jgi:autotransporter-associated beta strand protein